MTTELLSLPTAEWAKTRETFAGYVRVVSAIRRAIEEPHPLWWHASLRVTHGGLTTGPMTFNGNDIELKFLMRTHQLIIKGADHRVPIEGQGLTSFRDEVLDTLEGIGVKPKVDRDQFTGVRKRPYDGDAVEHFHTALRFFNGIFGDFANEQRGETSPVQFWPHHLDLAVTWFTGRTVDGVDPSDEENAREQMTFGFSPGGDLGQKAPYIYAYAYPSPEGLTAQPIPAGGKWLEGDWTGAIMAYDTITEAVEPRITTLRFLRSVQAAAAELIT